jgi:signal transduction histidine kinase
MSGESQPMADGLIESGRNHPAASPDVSMTPDEQFQRYQELQRYVGWTDDDARRVQHLAPLLDPHLRGLVDDFYAEIDRHPDARKVITGGDEQIARLKGTLVKWLQELLAGPYDRDYVTRRWRVGWRHVEIGLDQVYTNVALSRLRKGLLRTIEQNWPGDLVESIPLRQSLNTLLDLDLAIIEDAYQAEHLARRQRIERFTTIGQIGGGIAHELRNPLNVIKTSIYFLLNARNPTPEKRDEHLKRIERQVILADGVITALSNFTRMPVPDLKPIAVEDFVEDVLLDHPLPETIEVVKDLPPDLPPVLADRGQLKIVLSNLIRNAIDAMPAGGVLTISGEQADNPVNLRVSDTGVGIPPDRLARITEPLFTTKAKGLGLGLALARAILERNRGSLHAASEVGVGTTFTVRLAAADSGGAEDGPVG